MNALELSHIEYLAVLLPTMSTNIIETLEKQLGWAKFYLSLKHCAAKTNYSSFSETTQKRPLTKIL